MAIIRCRECNKKVSSEAKKCPYCGIKKPKPENPLSIISGVIIFIGLIWIFFSSGPITIQELKQSCESGNDHDCKNLGDVYYSGKDDVRQNYLEAVNYYKKACLMSWSSRSYCNDIGDMYNDGIGVKADYAEAQKYYKMSFKYYKKECEQYNSAISCRIVSNIFLDGKGVKKSPMLSILYEKMACEAGDSTSCLVLRRSGI